MTCIYLPILHLQQPGHEDVGVVSVAAAPAPSARRGGRRVEAARPHAGRVVPYAPLALAGHREVVVDNDLVHLEDGRGSRDLSHLQVMDDKPCLFLFVARASDASWDPTET